MVTRCLTFQMIEVVACMARGPVFLAGELMECLITFTNPMSHFSTSASRLSSFHLFSDYNKALITGWFLNAMHWYILNAFLDSINVSMWRTKHPVKRCFFNCTLFPLSEPVRCLPGPVPRSIASFMPVRAEWLYPFRATSKMFRLGATQCLFQVEVSQVFKGELWWNDC